MVGRAAACVTCAWTCAASGRDTCVWPGGGVCDMRVGLHCEREGSMWVAGTLKGSDADGKKPPLASGRVALPFLILWGHRGHETAAFPSHSKQRLQLFYG